MSKRTQTLRSRLTTLVVVAIFGAVGIATASSVWRETTQFGMAEQEELNTTAAVFAAAMAAPVNEQDKDATLNALQTISHAPDVLYIRIDDASGALFADLGEEDVTDQNSGAFFTQDSPLSVLTSQVKSASAPIVKNGTAIARLTVYAKTGSLTNEIGTLIYDALVAAIFAGGIGMLIALKMQRAITDPISNLAKVMASVREEENFSVRAETVQDEETAELVDTFNTMLDHIQERDVKLKTHQRNLEKTVELRTREMRKAKDAAIAANTAKSDFLATMSHEIRTPMNGMLAMADLLSKASLAPRHKRYAEVIAKSGQGLLAIINDILDLSKIEAGKLELENIPVRPAEILDDVVGLFWERAASKHIDLAAYVAPNTPAEIEGDPVRINQILSNLVNNALKFTEKGHVIVAVSCKKVRPDDRCRLEFSVTDTGAGIAKEKQSAIFEAFSQADQSTTRQFGGTGLGLAICQRLVKAMDGELGLASKPGKGSRFFFNIETKVLAPAEPVRRVREEKRAVIAIGGDATPRMLALYLREVGVIPHIAEQNAPLGPHIACADMIFASPEFYHVYEKTIRDGAAQWVPARICICELGDTAPDTLVERGVVEDILLAPLSRQDVMAQIGRILDNRMRGKDALANTSAAAPASHVSFKGQRILAADDSAINREVVQEALKRLNLQATLAENGREALMLAQEEEFALVLMDCSMPVMDGFEATKAIRAFETKHSRNRTPIVALTAHVAGAGDAWREAGMDACLTKPFTLDSLSKTLRNYLETGPARSDAPAMPAANEESGTEPPENGPVFDPQVLDQIAAMQSGDTNLPVRTLSLFQEHSRDALKNLAARLKEDDPQAVAMAAHALKSMSLNVGAKKLAAACSEIEMQARQGAPKAQLTQLCRDAASAYREAHSALPSVLSAYQKSAA